MSQKYQNLAGSILAGILLSIPLFIFFGPVAVMVLFAYIIIVGLLKK